MNFKALQHFMDTLPSRGIPTADLVVMEGHEERFRHQVGKPLTGHELYFMYSCTKLVTCVAAMQLFEQGKFLMNDPISTVLPEFADVRVKNGAYTVPAVRPITFRHLFTMTAGLGYNLTSAYIQDVSECTGGRCPTRETVAAMAKIPLDFQPGEGYQYSLCHDVLAAAVEVMSGIRFGAYLKKYIFDPCGMQDATFALTDDVKARMAPQYRFNDRRGVAEEMPLSNMYVLGSEYESGGAGLICSLSDYAKFAATLASGGVTASGVRILSPASIALMRADCLTDSMKVTFREKWPALDGFSYGYGVRTCTDPAAGILAPAAEFGWHGAAGSLVLIDPAHHISLFYAQHMLNNQEAYVHPRLRHCLMAGME